jgi:hypothetical protein
VKPKPSSSSLQRSRTASSSSTTRTVPEKPPTTPSPDGTETASSRLLTSGRSPQVAKDRFAASVD